VAATRWKFSCSTSAEWQRGSSAASIYGANQARETQFYYAVSEEHVHPSFKLREQY